MKNPFMRLFRSRDKPQNIISSAPTFYFGSSLSGKTVNPKQAVQVSAVYACVRVIAETIASLPVGVYEETDDGIRKAKEHPLYTLLHDEPNHEMTSFIMRETMMCHLLLWGNSYSQIIRSGKNKIVELYPLQPDHMEVDRDENGVLTYTYTTAEGNVVYLKPSDVLHVPGLGFDGIMGYSPIALEKNAIGLGIAAEEYGSTFFKNGARPSGVLTHPNQVKDPKRLRESWNATYGGSSNGGKVAVLEEGMVFSPISMPNNEAQFLETRKFQVEEICRIYRVPPHMIGDLSRSTFSNIEHQSIDFAIHTIRPWVVRIEQAMNRILLSDSDKGRYYIHFNLDGLMRGDYKSRMEGYSIGRQNGWLSANDIRELENLNPISDEEGGNTYLINGNMLPINLCGLSQLVALANVAEPEEAEDAEETEETEETVETEETEETEETVETEETAEQSEPEKKPGKKKSNKQPTEKSTKKNTTRRKNAEVQSE